MKSRPSPDSEAGPSGQPPSPSETPASHSSTQQPSPAKCQGPQSSHTYNPQLSKILYTTRGSQEPREVVRGFELGGTEFQPCICHRLAV